MGGRACRGARKRKAGKLGGSACSGARKRKAGKLGGSACSGAKKRKAGKLTSGNNTRGTRKRMAGKRSGIKRCARHALVVKKQWVDKILAGEKDWEIRGCATARRGWIHFAESKAGGTLVGRARLVDCIRVPKAMFKSHVRRHCVTNVSDVPYKSIFAWVFEDAERFAKPFAYKHSPGAVIWVKV